MPVSLFPSRYRTLYKVRTLMTQHWMLTRIEDDGSQYFCHLYMNRVGEPTGHEVLGYCGYQVYLESLQGVCRDTPDYRGQCSGLTLHYIGPITTKLATSIMMPGPVARMQLTNCPPWGECEAHPQVLIAGMEPLVDQGIKSVHIEFEDGTETVCAASNCVISLPFTEADGMRAEYYVSSTYGDESEIESFLYRNIALPDGTFSFQVIGTDRDDEIPTSAEAWDFFPDLEGPSVRWLYPLEAPEDLATRYEYAYLAGVLILRGDVNAFNCLNGGLLYNHAASACGIEQAQEELIIAQNRHDNLIFQAAVDNHLPPQILKGVIAQESQFWNGWLRLGEYGYGMLTDEGADLLLTWHTETFLDLCIPPFGEENCSWGYSKLADYPRAYLRGQALAPIGTDAEFDLIARMLVAAARQSGQMVRNVSDREPGDLLNYKELWLLTLGMYHGGGGCVGEALDDAWADRADLRWATVSEYLVGDCRLVADYPYKVVRFGTPGGYDGIEDPSPSD